MKLKLTSFQGACIIRMLNEVLGDKLFFEGINNYLTTYEYSNAEQRQLYVAINEVYLLIKLIMLLFYLQY